MRTRALLDRIPTWAWLVLIAAAMLASFRLGLGPREGAPRATTAAGAAGNQGSIAALRVRLVDGSEVPLAPDAGSAVVMVSSQTCTFCNEALRDLARLAGGRPLPGLRVVTLEGAAAGTPMLARHALERVWHAGPAGGGAGALLTFQFPGTPTFLLVDDAGTVRASMVGYPGREAILPWFRVMTGEARTLGD